jgi:hypothetical protein
MSQFFQTLEKTIELLVTRKWTTAGLHNLYFVIPDWDTSSVAVHIWPCPANPEGGWPSGRPVREGYVLESVKLQHVDVHASDKLPSEQAPDSRQYPGKGISSSFTLHGRAWLGYDGTDDYQKAHDVFWRIMQHCSSMPPDKRRAVQVSARFLVQSAQFSASGKRTATSLEHLGATLLQYYDPSSAAPAELSLNEHLLETVPDVQDDDAQ